MKRETKYRELKLGEIILPGDVAMGRGPVEHPKDAMPGDEEIDRALASMPLSYRPVPARLHHSPYSKADKDFFSHGIRRAVI